MFERYNESARRALFFGRFEASKFGSYAIETEHVLLGLLRDKNGIAARIFAAADVHYDAVRNDLKRRSPPHEEVSTSVEIPFSPDTKRILYGAAAESEHLGDDFIGIEHLLLSTLLEPDTGAARILAAKGLAADKVREQIVRARTNP